MMEVPVETVSCVMLSMMDFFAGILNISKSTFPLTAFSAEKRAVAQDGAKCKNPLPIIAR